MEANQQSDALWEKAGSHNTGFAPQSGETYGVAADSASVYSAANTTSAVAATLPAGTLLRTLDPDYEEGKIRDTGR